MYTCYVVGSRKSVADALLAADERGQRANGAAERIPTHCTKKQTCFSVQTNLLHETNSIIVFLEKGAPWHVWEDERRLTGGHEKPIRQHRTKHELCSQPIRADPICPFPTYYGLRQ